ncbi:MAG: thermonuclease family protein [Acidobacteriota bacterium]|nr:thermonuclease family protein [Acidobacteriota bacterium]
MTGAVFGLLLFSIGLPARAGDSLYGTITEVKRADVVVLDYGEGQMELKLIGIEVPTEAAFAAQSKSFVSNLVLGKSARMRFQYRTPEGVMLVRLFTDDPVIGIKEVAVELVRAGLARRQEDYDFKYGELTRAERDARTARRGLWAAEQQ